MINSTLHLDDYKQLELEVAVINEMKRKFPGQLRFEHEHRYWEYGVALKVIRDRECSNVLEVGGGCSPFHPSAEHLGFDVLGVDADPGVVAAAHTLALNVVYSDITDFISDQKYDAVVCLSVLEHIVDDEVFFNSLLDRVADGGVLVTTFDFHPSGDMIVAAHLRTYNDESVHRLIGIALQRGFSLVEPVDYTFNGAYVNGCTFASLCVERN